MKTTFILAGLFMTSLFLNAQNPTLQWTKSVGGPLTESYSDITLDASNNSYLCGAFNANADFDPGSGIYNLVSNGDYDVVLTKLNSSGDLTWAKSLGGSGRDVGSNIKRDASGNLYVAGTFEGTVDFDPGAGIYNLASIGGQDVFILKLDASGNFIWAKSFGGPIIDFCESLEFDAQGNTYLTGSFYGQPVDFDPGAGTSYLSSHGTTNTDGADIFILKLDASGAFVWAKNMGGVSGGTTNSITAYSSKVDASGNVYTIGWVYGVVDMDPDPLVTYNTVNTGENDLFISKLDASGHLVWVKQMESGATNSYSQGVDLALDAAGNIYVAGNFVGTVDFDSGSGTNLITASGAQDVCLLKMDATGNIAWIKKIGSVDIVNATTMELDALGNIYIGGHFQGTVDMDPGMGNYNITGNTDGTEFGIFTDVFLLKMDASGNFTWAKQIGGLNNTEQCDALAIDALYNVYAAGSFDRTTDFDPDAPGYNVTALGHFDAYVLKFGTITPVGISKNEQVHNISVFPNPTKGIVNIKLENINNEDIHIKVINSIGQEVINAMFNTNTIELNTEQLTDGIYFIKVIQKEKHQTFKIIKA